MKNHWFPRFFAIFINCLRCPEILQKCFQHGRWKPPRPPKTLPRDSQDAPRWPQNVTRMPQVPPKMLQVPPKMPPRPLQDAQNASKSAQEAPKLPQEPPNTPPSRSTARFLEVWGLIFGRLGKVWSRFSCSTLWPIAGNMNPSLIPSLNPKFQSQHVNRLFSRDDLHG